MSLKCQLKFDTLSAIYFAGQTISGICELTLDTPRTIRTLQLRIEGFAECHWSENGNTSRNERDRTMIHYRGREVYLNSLSYLIGGSGGNQVEIPAGLHTYNFACMLPRRLPSSFEGTYGHIRYTATITIDRQWKFDINHRVGFIVVNQRDLNETPVLGIPTKMEIVKTFCCWFCSQPFYMSASIPVSGYVTGQSINVSVEINNQTRVNIDSIRVALKKIIQYHSQTPSMRTRREVIHMAEARSLGIQQYDHGIFVLHLAIPPVPPSNTICTVINLSYVLQVKAHTVGMHTDPRIQIPITIGTIPLACTFTNFNEPSATPVQTTSAYPPSAPATYITDQENLINFDPPSYEEISKADSGAGVHNEYAQQNLSAD